MTFAEQIRSIRKDLGFSQAKCSELCAVSVRTWQGWEAGKPVHVLMQEAALVRLSATQHASVACKQSVRMRWIAEQAYAAREPILKPSGKL